MQAGSHTAALWRGHRTRPTAVDTIYRTRCPHHKKQHRWQRALLVNHAVNWEHVWLTPFKPRFPFDNPEVLHSGLQHSGTGTQTALFHSRLTNDQKCEMAVQLIPPFLLKSRTGNLSSCVRGPHGATTRSQPVFCSSWRNSGPTCFTVAASALLWLSPADEIQINVF